MTSVVRLLALTIALLGTSCGSTGDSTPPTCEAVGAHLSEICMSSFFGEGVRSDCQVFGLEPAARTCLLGVTQCGSAALSACGVTNVVVVCSAPADCPAPLMCDQAMQECVECTADTHCPSGKICFGGICAAGS